MFHSVAVDERAAFGGIQPSIAAFTVSGSANVIVFWRTRSRHGYEAPL